MKLELAIVFTCNKTGCQLRLVNGNAAVEATYSSLVQDRIKIRPQHLVVIDMDTKPPEIVWRWLRAAVIELSAGIIVVDDMKGNPVEVSLVPDLPLRLEIDDEVWACGTPRGYEIHDIILDGKPTHPNRLLDYITPIIEEIYQQ